MSLSPDLFHVNAYGGTLLTTILHGADDNPQRAQGDYVACLRMVLNHGVALSQKAIDMAGNAEMRDVMVEWAKRRPGQVVAHGII